MRGVRLREAYRPRTLRLPRPIITLRRTTRSDVDMLHGFERDGASNELAGTKPREWETVRARWEQILADHDGSVTGVTPRVVRADGIVVGSVNISPDQGIDSIGHRIARER